MAEILQNALKNTDRKGISWVDKVNHLPANLKVVPWKGKAEKNDHME